MVRFSFFVFLYWIMDFSFDKVADVLYIWFKDEDVEESDEISAGIIINYSNSKQIIGLEIINFNKRNFNLNSLIKLDDDEIILAIKSENFLRKNGFW
jgi:uncharacterized protein YuzE